MIPYDERLDGLTSQEFWAEFHAAPDYPNLDRLRFIRDPVLRADLEKLSRICQRNDGDERIAKDLAEREKVDHERRRRLTLVKALEGRLGANDRIRAQSREIAERMLPIDRRTGERQQDPSMMRACLDALRELRDSYDRQDLAPSGGYDQMGRQ